MKNKKKKLLFVFILGLIACPLFVFGIGSTGTDDNTGSYQGNIGWGEFNVGYNPMDDMLPVGLRVSVVDKNGTPIGQSTDYILSSQETVLDSKYTTIYKTNDEAPKMAYTSAGGGISDWSTTSTSSVQPLSALTSIFQENGFTGVNFDTAVLNSLKGNGGLTLGNILTDNLKIDLNDQRDDANKKRINLQEVLAELTGYNDFNSLAADTIAVGTDKDGNPVEYYDMVVVFEVTSLLGIKDNGKVGYYYGTLYELAHKADEVTANYSKCYNGSGICDAHSVLAGILPKMAYLSGDLAKETDLFGLQDYFSTSSYFGGAIEINSGYVAGSSNYNDTILDNDGLGMILFWPSSSLSADVAVSCDYIINELNTNGTTNVLGIPVGWESIYEGLYNSGGYDSIVSTYPSFNINTPSGKYVSNIPMSWFLDSCTCYTAYAEYDNFDGYLHTQKVESLIHNYADIVTTTEWKEIINLTNMKYKYIMNIFNTTIADYFSKQEEIHKNADYYEHIGYNPITFEDYEAMQCGHTEEYWCEEVDAWLGVHAPNVLNTTPMTEEEKEIELNRLNDEIDDLERDYNRNCRHNHYFPDSYCNSIKDQISKYEQEVKAIENNSGNMEDLDHALDAYNLIHSPLTGFTWYASEDYKSNSGIEFNYSESCLVGGDLTNHSCTTIENYFLSSGQNLREMTPTEIENVDFNHYNNQVGSDMTAESYMEMCPLDEEYLIPFNCTPYYSGGTCEGNDTITYKDFNDVETDELEEDFWNYCVFEDKGEYDIPVHKESENSSTMTYYDNTVFSTNSGLDNPYCEVYCIEEISATIPSVQNLVSAGRYISLPNAYVKGERTCKTKEIDWEQFETDLNAGNQQVTDSFAQLQLEEYLDDNLSWKPSTANNCNAAYHPTYSCTKNGKPATCGGGFSHWQSKTYYPIFDDGSYTQISAVRIDTVISGEAKVAITKGDEIVSINGTTVSSSNGFIETYYSLLDSRYTLETELSVIQSEVDTLAKEIEDLNASIKEDPTNESLKTDLADKEKQKVAKDEELLKKEAAYNAEADGDISIVYINSDGKTLTQTLKKSDNVQFTAYEVYDVGESSGSSWEVNNGMLYDSEATRGISSNCGSEGYDPSVPPYQSTYDSAVDAVEEIVSNMTSCYTWNNEEVYNIEPEISLIYENNSNGKNYYKSDNSDVFDYTYNSVNYTDSPEPPFTFKGYKVINDGNCSGVVCSIDTVQMKFYQEYEKTREAEIKMNLPDGVFEYINKDNTESLMKLANDPDYNYLDLGFTNLPVAYATQGGIHGFGISGTSVLDFEYDNLGHVEIGAKETKVDSILGAITDEVGFGGDYGEWVCGFEVENSLICTGDNCGDGSNGGIILIYRPIDLDNPFPDINSEARVPGSNWYSNPVFDHSTVVNSAAADPSSIGDDEKDSTYVTYHILNNRAVTSEQLYELEPLYTFILTPQAVNDIRDYNDENTYGDTSGTYNGKTYSFTCNEGTGFACRSDYLTYLIDMYGEDSEKGICTDNKYRDPSDPDAFYSCRFADSDSSNNHLNVPEYGIYKIVN